MTISNPHIDVKDAIAGGWFGAREEAQLPARRSGAGPSSPHGRSDAEPARWSANAWLRRARRAAIDLAIILAAMAALPVLFVATNSGGDWRSAIDIGDTRAKVAAVDAMRPFAVAADPSITPLDAGRAFSALNPPIGSVPGFRVVAGPHPAMTWQRLKMPLSLRPTELPFVSNVPSSQTILQAAAKGFSPEETDYLRQLATAPVWAEFDRVAHARSMDMIAGRFVLPFGPRASIREMPAAVFSTSKEMAYAAVSRAAYHLAIGQRDSAEAILRSIVSFGFNIEDNGPGLMYQLIGRVIVEIGGNGLDNFFVVTHDPRIALVRRVPEDPFPARIIPYRSGPSRVGSVEQMRQELIARATNPNEIQGIRYASLELLQTSACTNVRELLFGQRADVSDAFRRAKIDLARFPSQQALIDLIQRSPDTDPVVGVDNASPLRRFLYGTSTIAGTVLHNPRLAACMWKVTEGKF